MPEEKVKFYVYKMTVDNGGAPCVHKDLMSLCICKPAIRRTAKKGDIVIGFGGKSVSKLKYRLIYIMKVDQEIKGEEYYSSKGGKWQERPDCIYELGKKSYSHREGQKYCGSGKKTDLGKGPSYENAKCLVSKHFRYFGGKEVSIFNLPKFESIKSIQELYESLPRSHKVHHDETTRKTLDSFVKFIFDAYKEKFNGDPTHPPDGNCNPCKPPRPSCK